MDDAERLFAWRNDPATRAASRNTQTMEFAEHRAWLEKSLAMSWRHIFIAEVDGTPVGTVRTDEGLRDTEVSWTVAPEFRGKGHGRMMVKTVVAQTPGPLTADVKIGNASSLHLAEAAGFRKVHSMGGFVHLMRA